MYITVYLMGGLGNQLFQIFTTISLSLKYKIPFKFVYTDVLKIGITRPTYWNNLLKSLKVFTDPKLNISNFLTIREPNYNYHPININSNMYRNIMLIGYYQSYKYFEENYSSIIKLIRLHETQNIIKNKYNYYFSDITISIHFRLGDYKGKQDYHPILSSDYYQQSLNLILKKINTNDINILYFCEKEDNQYILDNYINKIIINKFIKNNINIIKVDDNIEDWEQLIIMSNCHHNIIANSSFSWWGAYFNQNPDKIVCYPSIWFGFKANNNTKDLCPDNWIKIDY
jgi:hypothetical protein